MALMMRTVPSNNRSTVSDTDGRSATPMVAPTMDAALSRTISEVVP
jgi:hypothetical protein